MTVAEGQLLRWMEAGADAVASDPAAAYAVDVAALATEYSAILYRVAFSVLRNAVDAEDAVQETFLRVLRHREKLGDIQDMRVWLVRIVWNQALDRKRRQKAMPLEDEAAQLMGAVASGELRADAALIAAQGQARILQAIDCLPRKEREVLLLSAMEELATAEMAAVLGVTESSVRSRLFRARQRLRERLQISEGRRRG
ncbi:MAG TPA: RNA polymerase sigma factor [Acidobacteriaceae bacterium]|nr:RNA polymerase sigma factor [Acidobacteriaceae bacterium]